MDSILNTGCGTSDFTEIKWRQLQMAVTVPIVRTFICALRQSKDRKKLFRIMQAHLKKEKHDKVSAI